MCLVRVVGISDLSVAARCAAQADRFFRTELVRGDDGSWQVRLHTSSTYDSDGEFDYVAEKAIDLVCQWRDAGVINGAAIEVDGVPVTSTQQTLAAGAQHDD